MFQKQAAPNTAAYFRVSYNLFRILVADIWLAIPALIIGLVFLAFAELRLAGIIMTAISGPIFLFEVIFTNWFAKQAAGNLAYTLEEDRLVVESGVFIRRKAKIPFSRIQDVTTTQGPIERQYGIHTLLIQTAGQSGATGPEGRLRGITDPDTMADTIMARVRQFEAGRL